MTSIEKQNIPEEIKLPKSPVVNDERSETPIIITLVQGQSGTLYRSQSSGNGVPDKLLYE